MQVAPAKGGMYAFFKLDGYDDSLALAKRLVAEAGLGLAPGNAFAPEAQGWLRWCFASKDLARLGQGVDRLAAWLAAQAGRAVSRFRAIIPRLCIPQSARWRQFQPPTQVEPFAAHGAIPRTIQ